MRPYPFLPAFFCGDMSFPYNQFDTSDLMDDSQQQLSPVSGYPQWETIERGEQPQQHQTDSPLDTSMDSTTPAGPTPIAFRSINIELEEVSHNIIPPQIDDTPITLHHPHDLRQLHFQQQHQQQLLQYHQQHQQSRHPSVEPFSTHSSRPGSSQLHIATTPTTDIFRPQGSTPNPIAESLAGPSTSNTAGRRGTSRKTSGPIRSSGRRVTRSQQQAPYYRPSPGSTAASFFAHVGSGSSASSTPRIPQQAEPSQRKQSFRFTAPTGPPPIQTRAASRAAASSMMPSPVVQQSSPISQESAAT